MFLDDISYFNEDLVGLKGSFRLLTYLIRQLRKKVNEENDIPLVSTSFAEIEKKHKRKRDIFTANRVLPRSYIVALVSRYDAYLGGLIREMYEVQPEKLNASEKSISFSKLLKFESIEAAKESIIEKEIETVLRMSHAEQFDWLEKKLDIPLRKDLETWPKFIELTERRNLFVHTDGAISSQYISVCKQHGVGFEKSPVIGEKLTVSTKYYKQAVDTMLDIGLKLGHVMWMKLCPSDIQPATENINELSVSLIGDEFYEVAISILEFALKELGRKITHETKLMYTVNLAQAYKWQGENEKCQATLSKESWNTLSYKYRLAYYVLIEDFDKASNIMKRIGANSDELPRDTYSTCPLFKEFRETKEFAEAYEEIFGTLFSGQIEIAASDEDSID